MQWAAIVSIALHSWVAQAECDDGARADLSNDERERMTLLDLKNPELCEACENFSEVELDHLAKS